MAQLFPKWTNALPKAMVIVGGVTGCGIVFTVWFWFSPYHLEVGYEPSQPVPFSHELHAGQLGIDCRVCHTSVETGHQAGIPPTKTCMDCHASIKPDSVQLAPVHQSWADDSPIAWTRVHKLPDYAYFDHSAHIQAGVACLHCHGHVERMPRIRQVEPLSMSWCLECHRDPAPRLRPPDKITDPDWVPAQGWQDLARIKAKTLQPPVGDCSGCHR
ncbi:MAG: cytochrome c3 family protein [Myxococcota bacterium]